MGGDNKPVGLPYDLVVCQCESYQIVLNQYDNDTFDPILYLCFRFFFLLLS